MTLLKTVVRVDVEAIEKLCKEECSAMDSESEAEVAAALKRLNNNKAVDVMDLTGEHFKLAGQEISKFLTCFLNHIIELKSISVVLKEGILTPIFKKGDPSNPGNYRDITVTPSSSRSLNISSTPDIVLFSRKCSQRFKRDSLLAAPH